MPPSRTVVDPFAAQQEGQGGESYFAYSPPNPAYAAPSEEGAWSDTPEATWAPTLRLDEIPDAERLQKAPLRDARPPDRGPMGRFFAFLDADRRARHSVEDQDADGWDIKQNRKTFAPNPRSVAVPTERPTTSMSPRSYSFTRPFDQGSNARQLNGLHFSMADHRREYEILGMQPTTLRRNNSYRLPGPWDADIVDEAPDVDPTPSLRVVAIDIPPSGNRSYRL